MKKKNLGFIWGLTALAVISLFLLNSCPDFDGEEITMVYPKRGSSEVNLTNDVWHKILTDIGKQENNVHLDLKNMKFESGTREGGGLIQVTIDGTSHIVFNPLPGPTDKAGKNKIVSIVLPDAAEVIMWAAGSGSWSTGNGSSLSTGMGLLNSITDKTKSAFQDFNNLRSVSGENIIHIGNYAFYERTSLTRVDFPSVGHSVDRAELEDAGNLYSNGFRVDIGHYAFRGCTALQQVSFPNAAVIGKNAFEGCTSLRSLNFPFVYMIGENAFEGCTSLTQVEFPQVTKIGNGAFMDCTNLERAIFRANPLRFSTGTPTNPPNYDSVILYEGAFEGCNKLALLDVRNAWNVYFYDNVLRNTNTRLDLHIYDGADGFGHPQNSEFMGSGTARTLTRVNFTVYGSKGNIDRSEPDNIANYIQTRGVSVFGVEGEAPDYGDCSWCGMPLTSSGECSCCGDDPGDCYCDDCPTCKSHPLDPGRECSGCNKHYTVCDCLSTGGDKCITCGMPLDGDDCSGCYNDPNDCDCSCICGLPLNSEGLCPDCLDPPDDCTCL